MKNAQIIPATGTLHQSYARQKNDELLAKEAAFTRIWIDTPSHRRLHGELDYLRLFGHVNGGAYHHTLRCLAPPASGKSTVAKRYCAEVNDETAVSEGRRPVLHVSLGTTSTERSLFISLLELFKDPHATAGGKAVLKQRFVEFANNFKVELVIIDEIHHLALRRDSTPVVNALKSFLNQKICPLALFGTHDANDFLTANGELGQRNAVIVDIEPLPTDQTGLATLAKFLRRIDQKTQDLGVFRESSDFSQEACIAALLHVTKGVMGMSVRILEAALKIAIRRDASRIEIYDISLAIDTWAIGNGHCKSNPFTKE